MDTSKSRHRSTYFNADNPPLSMYLPVKDKPVTTTEMYFADEAKPDEVHKGKPIKKTSILNPTLYEEGTPDQVFMSSPYHGKLNMSFPPTKRSSHQHKHQTKIPFSPPMAYYPARMSFIDNDQSLLAPKASSHLQHPGRMSFSDEIDSFLPLMASPYSKNHGRLSLLDEENSFLASMVSPLRDQQAVISFTEEEEEPFLGPMDSVKVPFSWEEKPGVPMSPTTTKPTHIHESEGPFIAKDTKTTLPSKLPIPPGRVSSAVTFNDKTKQTANQRKSPAMVLSNHCRPPSKIHHSPELHILPRRSFHCRRQVAEDPFEMAMVNCAKKEESGEDHKLTNPRLSPKHRLNKIFESSCTGNDYGTSASAAKPESPLKKIQKRLQQKRSLYDNSSGSLFASCMGCKALDTIILA